MRTIARPLRAVVGTLMGGVLLSGCGVSVMDMPLPGGTDTGEDPIEVKAEFADVLDLVPQSTVKVDDVSVGKITEIDLEGETAVVTMELPADTELPGNAVAEIRQTSLLGEKFVSLSEPESGPSSEPLGDGDVIPLSDTGRNPEVEEVLGALSLLLNGGGVAQLKTIAHELNLALEGREDSAKSVFRQIEELMGQLDEGKTDIVRAIENLNRLSVAVSDQIGTIDAALDELPSALVAIDRQRGDLVRMLRALDELSDVGVRVIQASKQATIESFRQLVPVLTKFSESGDAFVDAFHVFLTYPFVDEVVGRDPQVARNLHMGDYTNLSINLQVKLVDEGDEIEPPDVPVDEVCTTLRDVRKELGKNVPLDELVRYLRDVEDLCEGAGEAINSCLAKDTPQKISRCLENRLGVTIEKLTTGVLEETCQLLGLPKACLSGGGGGGGGDGGDGGDGGGILPPLGLDGLPRAPFGAAADDPGGERGPTMGQLVQAYDPALVTLLVPGMVIP
ncbi:MAG TPA: MCE family protein [Nocardioides sp.]|nr:MCE family protein [Nocardioides sp.]